MDLVALMENYDPSSCLSKGDIFNDKYVLLYLGWSLIYVEHLDANYFTCPFLHYWLKNLYCF